MKKYIIRNLEPLLFGFIIAIAFVYVLNLIDNIIIKMLLINAKIK